MKKFKLLMISLLILLGSCSNNGVTSNSQNSNDNTTTEYKIESSGSFEVDYVSYQYPTLKKTVNNATTSVTLSNEIVVSSGCKWTLSKDIEGANIIQTKNMSLEDGHNYAYITVWDASEEHNTIYYVDVYRLSMCTYQFINSNMLVERNVVEENQYINAPNKEFAKKGYTFECWIDESGNQITFPYRIVRNIKFYTKWKNNKYTITFNTNGGNDVSPLIYDYGTNVTLPKPTKDGYKFVGWAKNGTIVKNNILTLEDDTLLEALWIDDSLDYSINSDYRSIKILSCNKIDIYSIYIPKYVSMISSNVFSNRTFLTIYCEATSQPNGWETNWNSGRPVYYGITKDNKIEKDGIIYVIQNNEAIVTRYAGNGTNVTIPSTIEFNGKIYNITKIGGYALSGCISIEKLTLPFVGASQDATGDNAKLSYIFGGTVPSSLKEVGILKGCTALANNAFYGCGSLENVYYEGTIANWCNISFGNASSNPMSYANHFYMLNSNNEYEEVTSIEIPDTVTNIGTHQFYEFNNVTSIIIPSSVETIGDSAFSYCESLTSITISSSVDTIESSAFQGCTSLENVYYEGTIEDWCNIKFSNMASTPMFYAKHFYMLNSNNEYEEVTSIEIPDTVTNIRDYQFWGFNNVTSITIPSSVTTIGNRAFDYCTSIEKIALPFVGASRDATGDSAKLSYIFGGTVPNSLKEVIILEGCTSIRKNAFYECTSLTSITLPNSVTTIGEDAFSGCSSLTSIIIPSSVTTIGQYAFNCCSSLTSIIIPSSVTTIGQYAFNCCTSLTIYCEVYCEVCSKPSGWNSYWNYDVNTVTKCRPVYWEITSSNKVEIDGIIYVIENDKAIVTRYVGNETSVTIPASINFNSKTYNVATIGGCAFSNCSSITNITIPSSVTYIGRYAFYKCTSLTIYCEASSKPSGWDKYWNGDRPVLWGCKH